jgi:hypothetical protein
MYWLFIFVATSLLIYSWLDPYFHATHYVLVWAVTDSLRLVRILPQNQFALVVGKETVLLYGDENDTYVSAVRLNTRKIHKVLHYRYLLDWIRHIPRVVRYDPSLDIVGILNHVARELDR